MRERLRATLESSESERWMVERADGVLHFLGEFLEKVEREEKRVEEVVV